MAREGDALLSCVQGCSGDFHDVISWQWYCIIIIIVSYNDPIFVEQISQNPIFFK